MLSKVKHMLKNNMILSILAWRISKPGKQSLKIFSSNNVYNADDAVFTIWYDILPNNTRKTD